MRKRWLSLLLALCLMLALFPAAACAADEPATTAPTRLNVLQLLYDMAGSPTPGAEARQKVNQCFDIGGLTEQQLTVFAWAAEKELIDVELDLSVKAEQLLPRSEVLSLFYRASGSPKTDKTMDNYRFRDVTRDSWFYSVVNWAVAENILTEDSLAPDFFYPMDLPCGVEAIASGSSYQLRMPLYNEDGLRFWPESIYLKVDGVAEGVTSVAIPEDYLGFPVKEITDQAFKENHTLTEIYIPGSVRTVGLSAFEGCTALQGAYLDNGVEILEAQAFRGCTALEWIILPDTITRMDEAVFSDCTSLTYFRQPKQITAVVPNLLQNCSALEEVILSGNVHDIKRYAFSGCTALTSVYYAGTEQQLNEMIIDPSGNDVLAQVTWYLLPSMPDVVYGLFDLPEEDNWAYPGIDFCLANEIMNGMGDGYFAPDGNTTRAQLVTILYRLMGEPQLDTRWTPFADLTQTWYQDAVAWAYSNGIVKGTSENTFEPDTPITREMMLTILYRLTGEYLELDVSRAGDYLHFPDGPAVSDWARVAMAWGVGEGLISGVGTEFGTFLQPQGSATRAQIAKVIMSYCLEILDPALEPTEGAPAA